MHLLEKNQDKIIWSELSANPSKDALRVAKKKNPDNIHWFDLSTNPSAMHLLRKKSNKINWCGLSCNTSETAMQLLEKIQMKLIGSFYLKIRVYLSMIINR